MDSFVIDEICWFQAYKENTPVKSKVKRKGTLNELGRMQLDPNDDRIFYELVDVESKVQFTCTTANSMIKITL